jgi:hypothetical protein
MAASRNSSGYSKPTRINAFFEYGFAEALDLHLEKKEQMQKLSSTMAISLIIARAYSAPICSPNILRLKKGKGKLFSLFHFMVVFLSSSILALLIQ